MGSRSFLITSICQKAEWLNISCDEAKKIQGDIRFTGWICRFGCQRVAGKIYDQDRTVLRSLNLK
ncbi:hypothetical protein [Pseudomonas sp. MWU12-2037]|uniref:hypothetical protein n=1 Tax=Pseudomonas sp. MWU12-2037 TaxID=2928690 RepID=UPI00200E9475|nr:hypothetical protein [Pseudomonas sp. MWU12-2037]